MAFDLRLVWGLTASLALASPAAAQEAGGPDAHRRAMRALTSSCAEDYQRLCPNGELRMSSSQDGLICLKSHKVDVSMRCRRSINAAQQ